MDVTLTFEGVDLSPALSTYKVHHEITYARQITALDGTEYASHGTRRPIVTFSMFPITDATAAEYYETLSKLTGEATFTDPYQGEDVTAIMRVSSDMEALFGLRSIDGNRYYKGGEIILRAVTPLA